MPYSSVVVASDTQTMSDATYAPSRTTTTMAFARNHHQNSLRLARPSKRAYFFQNRVNASRNPAPYHGAQSGGAPLSSRGIGSCCWYCGYGCG